MATQNYIISAEEQLPNVDIHDITDAFQYECRVNGGRPYRMNRDCWGTFYMNVLHHIRAYPQLQPLVDMLGTEFD